MSGRPGPSAKWPAENDAGSELLGTELGLPLSPELVVLALTHRSYAYERGGLPTNERLEFLGDSVLGLVVTEKLFADHPDLPEGQLAKLRSSVVNMHALAGVGRTIGLGRMLKLGHGEELTGGREKESIVADAVEAVLGAVYLQHGLDGAREVVHRLFGELLEQAPGLGAGLDWKTSLQELAAQSGLGAPAYQVTDEGPDHAKSFAATVTLGTTAWGSGVGRTKKEAEQRAAAAGFAAVQTGNAAGDPAATAPGSAAGDPAATAPGSAVGSAGPHPGAAPETAGGA